MKLAAFSAQDIIDQFRLDGELINFKRIETGHINSSFLLNFKEDNGKMAKYTLQQINVEVFKKPDELMMNIISVTSFLKAKIAENGGDPGRETLDFLKTSGGKYYFVDDNNNYWRCYRYIDGVYSCDSIDNPEVFYNAGAAFGTFQCLLHDFPIDSLFDTIPDFHDTKKRFAAFKKAVQYNLSDRLANVGPEIEFVLEREGDTGVVVSLLESGELPLRVTHNDTKLNNVLFDDKTNKAVCVIDLDTVMKGSALYDFGDSIRFGANTAAEDEKDLSRVSLDLSLFEQYVRGFLGTAGGALCMKEIGLLPFSAKLMTYECGMRFLTDYLGGDTYFKTAYPEHNLDRARTQFALVRDIEEKYDEMLKIVSEIAKE